MQLLESFTVRLKVKVSIRIYDFDKGTTAVKIQQGFRFWLPGLLVAVFLFLLTAIDLACAQGQTKQTNSQLQQELKKAERERAAIENRIRLLQARLERSERSKQQSDGTTLQQPGESPKPNQAIAPRITQPSSGATDIVTSRLMDKGKRRLVQLSDFKLIGGWRVPQAWQNQKSTAFSMGGISIESLGDENSFWISHHVHLGGAQRLTGGQPGKGDLKDWPLLKTSDFINVTKPHDGLFGAKISGVHWDPKSDRLWVSGRSHYAVPPHMGAWLVACRRSKDGQRWEHSGPFGVNDTTMQRNGGGFCRISPQFAAKYLEGRTLGLACGGYESGQGSSLGPTLTATFLSPDRVAKGVGLLGFGWNCDETKREYRFPDYSIKSLGWGINPKGGRGYWAAEETMGGPAWVETDEVQGLCYFVREGVGELIYALQRENFTTKSKSRLYRYSLDDLAEVAVGNRQPHEIHGSFEEYRAQGITQDLPGIPRGACFDSTTGRLFVFLKYSWKKGRESYPAIAVFKVAGNPLR